MKNSAEILSVAKECLENEGHAVLDLAQKLDASFADAVLTVLRAPGRLVVTGIGKSALIGQKIVATCNSTGQPSVFMHAADAIHGDLGILQPGDVVLCLSQSGNTPEIKTLLPLIKQFGNPILAITGIRDSFLGRHADFVLCSEIEKEACPLNLAPTTSSTAQLALGDALAVCLLSLRGFRNEDFARYHPGGMLGKKLFLKLEEMKSAIQFPSVSQEDSFRSVLLSITSGRVGATVVLDEKQIPKGIITDGDIRRTFDKNAEGVRNLLAKNLMTLSPITLNIKQLAVEAADKMKENNVSQIVLLDDLGTYAGIIHLHELIREGLL